MDGPAVTGPRVLLLESVHPDAHAELSARAVVHEAPAPDAQLNGLEDVRAIVTRGRGRVNDALLAGCPALEVVARAGVGLDNVDLEAAARRGVTVLNVPDALTETVAEHALALALAARRQVVASANDARGGRWEERARFSGEMVAGARTTVIGLGAIGARAAALLRAVGADVTTWSRTPREDENFEPDLARALDGADVVSLHVALTEETRGLLGAPLLERLAPGATVVNTARPAVVDRAAMLAALESGRVGAYAVDGFEPEPPAPSDPLLAHPGVIATPHVAALTRATYRDLCLATVRGVLAVLDGEEPSGGAQRVRS